MRPDHENPLLVTEQAPLVIARHEPPGGRRLELRAKWTGKRQGGEQDRSGEG
jgi:hypothetical protein